MRPTPRFVQRVPFFYGWVVAAAVALSNLAASSTAAPVFSIFIEPWSDEFGWNRTQISGIFSFATLMAAFAGPLVGRGLDRYGGRVILGVGAVLIAVSLVSIGFVSSLLLLYVAFSVGRVSMMNIQNLAAHTVTANWFIRRRALATAIVMNGNRVGLALWPVVAGAVVALWGWREAFWVLGAAVGVLALAPLLFVVARRPDDIGLHVDGMPPRPHPAGGPPREGEYSWTARGAVGTAAFWLLMGAHVAMMVSGGGSGVHRVPFFVGKGLEGGLVGPMLAVQAVGMALGGFVAAALMRRYAQRVVIGGSMLGTAAMMVVILYVPANGMAVLYGFAEGAFSGSAFAMLPVIYADYFGRISIGTIRGLTHPAVMAANAAGPLVGGIIYDARGDYAVAYVSFGVVTFAGALLMLLAKPPRPPVDSGTLRGETAG